MNNEAYESIFKEIKNLSYLLSESDFETWSKSMVLSPHLMKTLKMQHVRSILLNVLTNHSSYLLFLRRVRMEISHVSPMLPMNHLEILTLPDPTCIDDVKQQNESIMEASEKIDQLLKDWKMYLLKKIEVIKEYKATQMKLKRKSGKSSMIIRMIRKMRDKVVLTT